jgi:hypothetical protein
LITLDNPCLLAPNNNKTKQQLLFLPTWLLYIYEKEKECSSTSAKVFRKATKVYNESDIS